MKNFQFNKTFFESLGPSLSVFEVALRNALIRELETMTGSKAWYISFQSHPALKPLYRYIITASNQINTHGELTLGFWVSLFNAEYERYLWKDLRRAFPNLPKQRRQRKNVSAPLNTIRTLRNRVFHNEAISWNLTRLTTLHGIILDVIGWMNPMLPAWLQRVDRYKKVLTRVRKQREGSISFYFKIINPKA